MIGFRYIGREIEGRRCIIHRFSPLQQAVLAFLEERSGPFHLSELIGHLESEGLAVKRNTEGRLLDLLRASGQLLSRDDLEFIPRRTYFQGARFLVVPTPEELEEGILIPGHRFLPFCSHDVLPWNCILRSPEGRALRHRRVCRRVEDLLIHYTLFGLKNLPLILARDYENNLESLQADDVYGGSVQVTAFDLSTAYRSLQFEPGDALLLSVEDWALGWFRFERQPGALGPEWAKLSPAGAKPQVAAATVSAMSAGRTGPGWPGEAADWIRGLEEGFEQAFERLGFPADMEEMIAHAFFFGGPQLLARPAMHLGGFLQASDRVDLITIGTDTCLWRAGEDPEEVIASCCPMEGPRGDDDSLEAILNDLGVSVSPDEIEAYMRDELFRRGRDLERVLERCFQGRSVEFYDDEQERAFRRFIHELWEEICSGYNYFADQAGGALRRQALELLDAHLCWLRSLDSRGLQPDDLPVRSLFEIGQSMGQIGQLLTALNHIDNVPPGELERMSDALQMLDRAIRERIDVAEGILDSCVPAEEAQGLRLVPRNGAWYVLKISLRGLRPPVWRRVRVPGGLTLGGLHRVIQTVMGWHDCRVHVFLIEGVEYGDPRAVPDGYLQYEDENAVTLQEVLRNELLRFRYEYDFGDGWEHHIAVEKVLPCSAVEPDERERPVCLAGRQASPPEDCEGTGGYRRLLENLQDPGSPRRSTLTRSPEREVGRFSLEEVNRRLGEMG